MQPGATDHQSCKQIAFLRHPLVDIADIAGCGCTEALRQWHAILGALPLRGKLKGLKCLEYKPRCVTSACASSSQWQAANWQQYSSDAPLQSNQASTSELSLSMSKKLLGYMFRDRIDWQPCGHAEDPGGAAYPRQC